MNNYLRFGCEQQGQWSFLGRALSPFQGCREIRWPKVTLISAALSVFSDTLGMLWSFQELADVVFLSLPPQPVHSITLLLNLLACLAWFTVEGSRGVDFGLSILWLILFTPCAFLCWYRPIYKAFRQVLFFSLVFFFVMRMYLLVGGAWSLSVPIMYCLQDFSTSLHH